MSGEIRDEITRTQTRKKEDLVVRSLCFKATKLKTKMHDKILFDIVVLFM